jgi:hypothetical protein
MLPAGSLLDSIEKFVNMLSNVNPAYAHPRTVCGTGRRTAAAPARMLVCGRDASRAKAHKSGFRNQ